jgi:hypothetical protein
MEEGNRIAADFPDDWLEAQRGFWSAWAEGAGGADDAQAAWAAACRRWWGEMVDIVPEPLGGPLKAALEQTRVCLELMGRPADGAAPDVSQLFAAVLDALGPADGTPPSPAEARYLRAWQAYVDLLAGIASAALAGVGERLAAEQPADPAAVHGIYASEVEARYLEAAAGDAFARAVGELVNARSAMLQARRGKDGA